MLSFQVACGGVKMSWDERPPVKQVLIKLKFVRDILKSLLLCGFAFSDSTKEHQMKPSALILEGHIQAVTNWNPITNMPKEKPKL